MPESRCGSGAEEWVQRGWKGLHFLVNHSVVYGQIVLDRVKEMQEAEAKEASSGAAIR